MAYVDLLSDHQLSTDLRFLNRFVDDRLLLQLDNFYRQITILGQSVRDRPLAQYAPIGAHGNYESSDRLGQSDVVRLKHNGVKRKKTEENGTYDQEGCSANQQVSSKAFVDDPLGCMNANEVFKCTESIGRADTHSNAASTSSNSRIEASLYTALANVTRARCPPLKVTPPSPIS